MSLPLFGVWNVRGFNRPDKVFCCKRLIQSLKLDMLCILETRIHVSSLMDSFFESSHQLFSNEDRVHNFDLVSSGRIWIKWDANKLTFTPSLITSQLINGTVKVGNFSPFQLSIVYAANNACDRKDLWASICAVAPSGDVPWAVIGDFNCCRYASDKMGGLPLHHSQLVDINNMIFVNKLVDLNAVGSHFSWYNQQTVNPIFIKLDRALVNEDWIKNFPDSYSSFQSPSCSDHSPIILHPGRSFKSNHRFMFKNIWTKYDSYWSLLLNAFSKPIIGNPLSHFCLVLRQLKGEIKHHQWANSKSLSVDLDSLYVQQQNLLDQIHLHPLELNLTAALKKINLKIADVSSSFASWVIQRAKLNWLHHGEDDLKFLYAKIRSRQGRSKSLTNLFSCNPDLSREEVLSSIVEYFQILYNSSPPSRPEESLIPVGDVLSDSFANILISPILEAEIKEAVFKGSSKSSPGPDGFNYHFYKSGWHIIGPHLCKAINAFFTKGYLPSGIKATALAIIPKQHNASSITDYRPISLCYFCSTSGLRQGCPLSPYLFCIVMDALSNLLEARGFKGFNAENFQLSHLLYADDVLIFGEATIENCTLLSNILNEFGNASSLKISYLGIPIAFNRLKVADYFPLMDSIHKKFNDWKANLLSLAGRLQYLKFTIQNTIAYWIRGSILPKTVFKLFKKTCSRFLFFGDIDCSNKLHMVSWDNVCKPKSKGGLGLPSLFAIQFAFNCSIIYRMYNSSSPLAVWLSTRYTSPWKPPPPLASKFWLSICKTVVLVKDNFRFSITPTAPIALFWDNWCDKHSLCDLFGSEILSWVHLSLLRNYIVYGVWNLPVDLPHNIRDFILSFPILNSSGPCLRWNELAKVKFSDFLEEFYSSFPACPWDTLVWHQKYSLKHSVYVWLALVGGLKTQDALRMRNIYVPEICSLCHNEPESVNHLFFECPYGFAVLESLLPATREFLLRPTVLHLLQWLDSDFVGTSLYKQFCKLVVCCTIYYIWRERNSRRFANEYNSINSLKAAIKRVINIKIAKWKDRELVVGNISRTMMMLRVLNMFFLPLGRPFGNQGNAFSQPNFISLSPRHTGPSILLQHYLTLSGLLSGEIRLL
ncbi:uncharacterized protein LOC110096820 [Dendrobium catenatum]|uniref:uncharacterized protein LOC110096820 n=1 Tax=Dendrobium catenatum TaxID=906689 RepID=UPI00109F7661|nr:uncharacterized protein LOC110096820 [Dendrobium catenatum]